jgi:hypothetical protein
VREVSSQHSRHHLIGKHKIEVARGEDHQRLLALFTAIDVPGRVKLPILASTNASTITLIISASGL